MQNYEGTVLFWLLPSDTEQEDRSADLITFRGIINDTRIFHDVDECIATLSYIADETVFLVLGYGRSYLVNILSSFTDLHYIYLNEPHDCANTPQVRGVFPRKEELLHQLKKDVKFAENNGTHITLSSNNDFKLPQSSTRSLQERRVEFKWMHMLVDIFLHMQRPDVNINQDLIHELRLVYQGNENKIKEIDKFEKDYESKDAIRWYTSDFLYTLVNAALRTQNMMIIWRFRFVILDIYKGLGALHAKQNEAHIDNQQQSFLKVYRGQYISPIELENFKKDEGELIALTSFVSTTKNPEVANMFAGDGAEKPNLKPVVFEICIDQFDSEHEARPFADISCMSKYTDEDEILLCMGTVMRIESVELDRSMARVCLRTCRYDDPTWRNFNVDLLPHDSLDVVDETLSLSKLAICVGGMGNCHQAEQLVKMIKPTENLVFDKFVQIHLITTRARQINFNDFDFKGALFEACREIIKLLESIIDSQLLPKEDLDEIVHAKQYITNITNTMQPLSGVMSNHFMLLKKYMEFLKRLPTAFPAYGTSSFDILSNKSSRTFSELAEASDQQVTSVDYDYFKSTMAESMTEKDPIRSLCFVFMAYTALEEGDYDRAIGFVQDGLSIPCNESSHIALYQLLGNIYKKQGNWPAVIEAYQNIIRMPQLTAGSTVIVEAYINCGDVYSELGDFSEAFVSYTNALTLQCQHYSHDHPLTGKLHIKIGKVFEKLGNLKDALKKYQEAISMGDPGSVSAAYQNIGLMYQCLENYDMARSNLIKSIETGNYHSPEQTISLVCSYAHLIRLLHDTGNHRQRDFYLNELFSITSTSELIRGFIEEQIQGVLDYIKPISE